MSQPPDQNIKWLLSGDPAIRWQVQQDLLREKPTVWKLERKRVAFSGWGARLLAQQAKDGSWGNGIYSPKWTSTTYTMLLLRQLGLPQDNPSAQKACALFLAKGLNHDGGINLFKSLNYSETCINGMLLALLCYFRHPDARVHSIIEFLQREQMKDGGWNCQRIHGATHASFHTTISVLEGLKEYQQAYPRRFLGLVEMIGGGQEFLLIHRLYKSHHTGQTADPAMTHMYFPPRWHYDFLRALDYFQSLRAGRDERMSDAIELLKSKQMMDGKWLMNKPWSGRVFFQIEETGRPSRWNTLRALRVMKWWEG